GVLAAWVQCAEVPPDSLCNIFAAINSQFKNTMTFSPRPGNLVLLGSQKPIRLDFAKLEKTIEENPSRKIEMAKFGIGTAMDLIGHMAISTDGMKSLVASEMNTDDRNRLEFEVGRSYEDKKYGGDSNRLLLGM